MISGVTVLRRLLVTGLTGLAVVSGLLVPAAAPAHADPRGPAATERRAGAPGSVTGYGFDACTAPSQAVMDAWWEQSPYSSVGLYTGGSNRVCQDQPELTATWVRTQQRRGWHVLPIHVGPQASCSGYADRMSSNLATAGQQGRAEATSAVSIAAGLGIGRGSTLYYDLEDYDLAPDDCRQAALSFLSGWSDALHDAGYDSGVYSNIAAAITSLDLADRVDAGYTMPDDIWFAWANGHADTVTDERVLSDEWNDHARIHQYRLDTPVTYGGYTLTVDENWVDVGRGSVPARSKRLCGRVDVDLRSYPARALHSHGPAVAAAQCLLRTQRFTKAAPTGRYDARTAAAVRKAQRALHLPVTGKLTRRTWVALLARGSHPLLKVGSTGDPVRRLERALTAALHRAVRIDGVVTQRTERAIRKYQKKARLPTTGVVTNQVWDRLLSGR